MDLVAIGESALAVSLPLLEGRGIRCSFQRPEGPVPLEADRTRLEQVVNNLLSNSVKFTGAGGTVDVTLERSMEEGVLRVRDSGRGIPESMTERVFEPFVQVAPGRYRTTGGLGLGLGLTLVKRLVQMHGGTVRASGGGVGQGTTFEIRLPAPSRRARRSLDVHDALLPGVAFVDIGLPGMVGYAVARAVRAQPGGEGLYLVALTGYGGLEAEASARTAGFDLHLAKPVDGSRLMTVIDEAPLRSGQAASPTRQLVVERGDAGRRTAG